MERIYWSDFISEKKSIFDKAAALTIGSFDGPHKGHESLFNSVLKAAEKKNLIPGLVTFTQALPGLKHPDDYLGDISTLEQRLLQFEEIGFSFVLLIDFNSDFMKISGQDFFKLLSEKLNLRYLAEGQDFHCGHKGLFGIKDIQIFCEQNGIEVDVCSLVQTEGKRISSSFLRQLIKNGRFSEASELLERPYQLQVTDFEKKEKEYIILRKNLKQVVPDAGKYQVLVNGNIPAELLINENLLLYLNAGEENLTVKTITFTK